METLQADRKMGRKIGLRRRCCSHPKNKTAKPAAVHDTHAFLSQVFPEITDLPLNNLKAIAEVEKNYYQSLERLSKLYHFRPKSYQHLSYPNNICASFEHAKNRIAKKDGRIELVIVAKDNGDVCLSSAREYDTSLTLLLMPLDVLCQLHQRANAQAFWLLISCYAYLHQRTGMFLCDKNSYVFGCYETNMEWIENEESFMEEEEFKGYYLAYTYMRRCVNIFNREIKAPVNLDQFSSRLASFKPVTKSDHDLLASAQKLHDVFIMFPGRSFTQNSSGEFLHCEIEEKGYLYQYFSFCWSTDGALIDQYIEYVNSDLQEREAMDAPLALQIFDQCHAIPVHNFSFEEALQNAICQLAETLNQLT